MSAVVVPEPSPAPSRRPAASRHDLAFARDVLAGLAAPRKSISGRWRLDARGRELQAAIELADPASPARLERSLLASAAVEIAAIAGADARLLCLGSDVAPGLDILRAAIEQLVAPMRPQVRRRILFVPGSVSATLPSDAATSARLAT